MRVINTSVNTLSTRYLVIGFEGENERTQIRIDAASVFDEYPQASPSMAVKPGFGEEVYPVIVTKEGNEVVWDVTQDNLDFTGDGEIQLTFIKDNVICKTTIGKIRVNRSLIVNGDPPEHLDTWYEEATAKLADVDEAVYSLEALDATASGLPAGSSPTVEVQDVNDHKRLAFGIPKGDRGDRGPTGNGIRSISQSGSTGLYKKYTIHYTDGTTTTFQVRDGDRGLKGDTGATPDIGIGTVETLPAGSEATASMSGTAENPRLNLGIPKGDQGIQGEKGDKGDRGATPVFSMGAVTNLPAGSSATATITGTAEEPVLNLGIPKGDKGDKGDRGERGPQGIQGIQGDRGLTGPRGEQGQKGDKGDTGAAGATGATPDLSIGTVSTLPAGSSATAEITGTAENPVLSLGIPQGVQGVQGVQGEKGEKGDPGEVTTEQMDAAIDEALQDYARTDGYYPDMTVGNAEQLNSSKYVENSEPYTLRTSGGSADIGNREYLDAVVGGTLAWNQIIKNGNFAYKNGWTDLGLKSWTVADGVASLTPNGDFSSTLHYGIGKTTSNMTTLIDGHKYFYAIYAKSTKQDKFRLRISNSTVFSAVTNPNTWVYVASIAMAMGFNDLFTLYAYDDTLYTDADTISCKNAVCFDLTQMLGSAVADYIYNLEQANAGAGVAWFKKLFPKDYYEYNAGELKHVEGLQSHDMVGFNLWDEEWDVGSIDGTSGQNTTGTYLRSKNFIPVISGMQYNFTKPGTAINYRWLYAYDENHNYMPGALGGPNTYLTLTTGTTFAVPSGVAYIRFLIDSLYGTTYKHDICISLAHNNSRNGEYEPYEKHSYPLDSTVVLRGIPKVGANGVYWDGDRYLPDGTVERKYGVVDLGTLRYSMISVAEGTLFRASVTGISESASVICTKYPTVTPATRSEKTIYKTTGINVDVIDSTYASTADFKSAMSGVLLVYELATPTTETAQPYHSTQWVSDWGTEEFVSTGLVPVGHETRYPANLRDKLQHLPDAASGNGSYLITQTDGQMVLTPFPAPPSTAGNYVLKATVTGGVATYTWEVAT